MGLYMFRANDMFRANSRHVQDQCEQVRSIPSWNLQRRQPETIQVEARSADNGRVDGRGKEVSAVLLPLLRGKSRLARRSRRSMVMHLASMIPLRVLLDPHMLRAEINTHLKKQRSPCVDLEW